MRAEMFIFFLMWRSSLGLREFPPYRGFTITLIHITFGRTSLDKWSARRRDLYLTQHITLTTDRHPCPPVGFEPTISASERPQTHALGRGYIGTRTDTTKQTKICLGIHRRQIRVATFIPKCLSRLIATAVATSPLQQHSNPMHTAARIWPDCRLETNALCLRQTVARCWEVTFQSYQFQCSCWHKQF